MSELDEIVLRLGARLTCAAELLTDDADPDAAAALETIIEHTYPALLDALQRAPVGSQTIWREGSRIRRSDGTGYGDQVSDDMIRDHIEHRQYHDPLFIPFARAVLALREFERAATRVEVGTS